MRRSSPSLSFGTLAVLAVLWSVAPACGPRGGEVSSPAPEASGIAVNTPALFDELPKGGTPTPPSPDDSAPPVAAPGEEPTPPPGIVPTLVGPAPTEDPATWTYVAGEILLGALRDMDSDPKTALSPAQLERVSAFIESISEQTKASGQAESEFLRAALATLTPRQWWAFSSEARELHELRPDVRAVVREVDQLASGAPAQEPSPSPSQVLGEAVRGANEVLVGLQFLCKHPKVPLTPEQARDLLPALKVYAMALEDLVAQYPRLVEVLTPAQRTAFAKTVNRVKPWEAAKTSQYCSFDAFKVYLVQRHK